MKTNRRTMLKSMAVMAAGFCSIGAITLNQNPQQPVDFLTWWKTHYSGNDLLKVTIIGHAGTGKSRLGDKLFEMQTGIRPTTFLHSNIEIDRFYVKVSSLKLYQILESDSSKNRIHTLEKTNGCVINIRQLNRQMFKGGHSIYNSYGTMEILLSHVVLKTYRKNGQLKIQVWKSRFGPGSIEFPYPTSLLGPPIYG